jgi:5-methylcytosine-specific restriction endonuclease McrA
MAWNTERQQAGGYLHPKKQQRIIATHAGICHLCGHPDAHDVDHLVPWAEWIRTDLSVHDKSNLAPAHGTPCPTCGRDCHADKTKAEAARGRARGQAKRKAQGRRPPERHPGSIA